MFLTAFVFAWVESFNYLFLLISKHNDSTKNTININYQYSNINAKNILYKRLKTIRYTIRYSTSTKKHHPYLAEGEIILRLTPTPCISFILPAPAPPVFQTFLRASRLETSPFCPSEEYRDSRISGFTGIRED